MLFCEECREKKNWPNGLMQQDRCETCGKTRLCYDVPSVLLIPEADRTVEQKMILDLVMDAYREKAEQVAVTELDGRVNNLMTTQVRKIFIYRNNEVDWYATFTARLTVQERYRESERAKRDRR